MPTKNSIEIKSRDFILMTTPFPSKIYDELSRSFKEDFVPLYPQASMPGMSSGPEGCRVSVRIPDQATKNLDAFLKEFAGKVSIESRGFILETILPSSKLYPKFEKKFKNEFIPIHQEASIPGNFSSDEGCKVSVQIPDWAIRAYYTFLGEFADEVGLKFQDPRV